jgi:hypothetical protein
MTSADCAAGFACIDLSTDGGTTGSCTQLCHVDGDCSAGKCTGTLACGGTATALKFCQ